MNPLTSVAGAIVTGLILFRRMLMEQMDIVAEGGDPMNTFRDPKTNEIIWLPFDYMDDEIIEGMRATPKEPRGGHGTPIPTGSSGKFNPYNLARARKVGATPPPEFPRSAKTVVEVSPG